MTRHGQLTMELFLRLTEHLKAITSWEQLVGILEEGDFFPTELYPSAIRQEKRRIAERFLKRVKNRDNIPDWYHRTKILPDGTKQDFYKRLPFFEPEDWPQPIQEYSQDGLYKLRVAWVLSKLASAKGIQIDLPFTPPPEIFSADAPPEEQEDS